MLAVIRGEPTDRIPWAPRMDLWYIALRARETVPERFAGLNTAQMADELGAACHAVGADFTLSGGRDVSLRGLGIDNHYDYPYRVELRDLPVHFEQHEGHLKARIETSSGDVTTHLRLTTEMAGGGISLPFVEAYAIESPDDFDGVAEVFEHLQVIPTPDSYASFDSRVGHRGIAVARGPIAASPVHLMLHELVAMDRFFYLYADMPDRIHALAERMTPFFDALLDALAASKAEVVFWGANYDQNLTWPPFFQAEIKPWLRKAADRFHAAGKLLLTHTDGENHALFPLYPGCGFDVAESVCPAPMTRCSLAEIRRQFGREVTVWGGIPSVALLPGTMDDGEFQAYLDDLFANLGSGERLIFGVSDNVPPDADLSRLDRIRDRIEAFGPVNPA
jgi:hypothetical protein